MKKYIAFGLALVCIFGLFGCKATTQPEDIKPIPLPQETENTQPPEVEVPDKIEDTLIETNIISTKYYSITVPEDWETYYTCEIIDGMHLSLYETKSYDASFGGWLVSVELYKSTEEYEFLPSYKLLGKLSTDDEKYDMIAIYPTDVQFSEENAEQYLKMSNQIEDVLKTVKPNDNVIFIAE